MNEINRDALEAIVDEDGIYATLTQLIYIMKAKAKKDPKREKLALYIARSIERARDSTCA